LRGYGSSLKIGIHHIQPPTPFYPHDIVRKDKESNKDKSKWQHKINNCTITCAIKWLLSKHLKEVHGLVAEKAKFARPSIS